MTVRKRRRVSTAETPSDGSSGTIPVTKAVLDRAFSTVSSFRSRLVKSRKCVSAEKTSEGTRHSKFAVRAGGAGSTWNRVRGSIGHKGGTRG